MAEAFALLAAAGSVGGIVVAFRRAQRERKLAARQLVIAILLVVVVSGIYLAVTSPNIAPLAALGGVAGGLAIGGAQARSTSIHIEDGAIKGQPTPAYLVVWGAAYVLTVAMGALASNGAHEVAAVAMLLGVGTTVGSQGGYSSGSTPRGGRPWHRPANPWPPVAPGRWRAVPVRGAAAGAEAPSARARSSARAAGRTPPLRRSLRRRAALSPPPGQASARAPPLPRERHPACSCDASAAG